MKVELLGGCTKNELESRIKRIAAAGKLSRFPGNVFEVLDSCDDYEKNLKMVKRIINMGHKSIIEHDYLVFALCDVSPIIEQIIIGNRLTSFTIKSRREVDFRSVGFYVPEFRDKDLNVHKDNKELQEKYKAHMQKLFNFYGDLVDQGIKGEDARFVLPYCYNSNIIMGLDGREFERLIISLTKGRLSRISELKELGELLYNIAKENVPYLVETIENAEVSTDDPFEYMESISARPQIVIKDKPELIKYTENADDTVLITSIMYHYQCEEKEAVKILNEMVSKDGQAKEKLMDIILHKSDNRELEQVSFTYQIPIPLAILTHLTRHRMHSLLVPEFTPMWDLNNYIIPPSVQAGPVNEYVNAVNENMKVYDEFKAAGIADEDLIYFYLGAQYCNVVTTMNGRTLQWICRMRCCNKAQWTIRNIAKSLAEQTKNVAPLIGKGLGSTCVIDGVCNEGKECCGLIDKLKEAKM